jgi:hypothetical protein
VSDMLFNAKWVFIMVRSSYIQWGDDNVPFVLEQQA